jgi:hypothetical protein
MQLQQGLHISKDWFGAVFGLKATWIRYNKGLKKTWIRYNKGLKKNMDSL